MKQGVKLHTNLNITNYPVAIKKMQLLERYNVKYVKFLNFCKHVYAYMTACICACMHIGLLIYI